MKSNAERIFDKYNSASDDDWKEIIREAAVAPMIDGIHFPLVPDEATQCQFAGAPLVKNVQAAYQYYKAIKDTYTSRISPIDDRTRLLDVGSGWGRVIRFFMKDIAPAHLSGCDVAPRSIAICNDCFRGELNFQLIKPLPPMPYAENCFDIVEGCSVFTHLSYYAVVAWMHEYLRILKPGGMLAMTVWKQQRFDFIRKLQGSPPISQASDDYRYRLQASFSRDCAFEEDVYNKAGAVYIPIISTNPSVTYGEAFISPALLADQWSAYFQHLTNYELDGDQQIVFFQKKADAGIIDDKTLCEIMKVAKMYDIQSICAYDYTRQAMFKKSNNCQDALPEKEAAIKAIEAQLAEQKRHVAELLDSASWRLTAPLRRGHEIMLSLLRRRG